jgi:hypothetical protein
VYIVLAGFGNHRHAAATAFTLTARDLLETEEMFVGKHLNFLSCLMAKGSK